MGTAFRGQGVLVTRFLYERRGCDPGLLVIFLGFSPDSLGVKPYQRLPTLHNLIVVYAYYPAPQHKLLDVN